MLQDKPSLEAIEADPAAPYWAQDVARAVLSARAGRDPVDYAGTLEVLAAALELEARRVDARTRALLELCGPACSELAVAWSFRVWPDDAGHLGEIDQLLSTAALEHARTHQHATVLVVGQGWACRQCDPDLFTLEPFEAVPA